jgi:tRNA (mo5U34)-methyltransferase
MDLMLRKYKNEIPRFEELASLIEEKESWKKIAINSTFCNTMENPIDISSILKDKTVDCSTSEITVATSSNTNPSQTLKSAIEQRAKELIPWRKGPFNIIDCKIDAEWRSDKKWERIKEYLAPIKNKRVLDIGCNNGYFMFRMLAENPEYILGIDPVIRCKAQFEFINNFVQSDKLDFQLLGINDVTLFENFFDTIFSMGIIYHHKNPIEQLIQMKKAMRPGGQLVLETLGVPLEEPVALFPEDRYAKMRNIWFLPSPSCLVNWAKKAKFKNVKLISQSDLEFSEQRTTPWCPPPQQSLEDFLDPNDRSKTIEGHIAPIRFCLVAQK